MLKSAFVTYNHTTIPPYDGVIGKTVSVPCCCVSLPLLPVVDESPKPIPEHDLKPMKLKYAVAVSLSLKCRGNTRFCVPLLREMVFLIGPDTQKYTCVF